MQNNKQKYNGQQGDVLKGLAAGLIGGLIASWTMSEFQSLWSKLSEAGEKSKGAKASPQNAQSGKDKNEQQQPQGESEKQEPATIKVAEAISENVFHHELSKGEKKIAGPSVHYAMGATSGAIYGVVSELVPFVTVGAGLPFGAAVWLTADEAALPALGFSKSPTEYPLSTHAYALASHFVYGLTTDMVRRAVRNAL